MEDFIFGDVLDDVIVEGEPFVIEFCVVYVVPFVDICANVGDYGEEIVCAVPIFRFVGNGVECVGGIRRHIQSHREADMLIYLSLAAIETLLLANIEGG